MHGGFEKVECQRCETPIALTPDRSLYSWHDLWVCLSCRRRLTVKDHAAEELEAYRQDVHDQFSDI